MEFLKDIKEKAKKLKKTILLPEADVDNRIMEVYGLINKEDIARIILIGDKEKILKKSKELHILIHEEDIIEPENSGKVKEFAESYYELRKKKGLSKEEAGKAMRTPLYFGAMMVRKGLAHGMVAGTTHTTAEVLRASIRVIGLKPNISVCSSFMIISLPYREFGHDGILFYADVGVVPDPDATQLADIAISTAHSFKALFNAEPRAAMLSFSSHGSSNHPLLKKVIDAARIANEKAPELLIDGELQADTALVPEVARLKVGSEAGGVPGKANILIFPDLNSGNIAYKLTQRLAHAQAYGPFIQGLSMPVSDLSRGATTADIVVTIAILAASTSVY